MEARVEKDKHGCVHRASSHGSKEAAPSPDKARGLLYPPEDSWSQWAMTVCVTEDEAMIK